jgi:hypothetical protein
MKPLTPIICIVLVSSCAQQPTINKPQSQAIVNSACALFPANSFWNTPVNHLPVHPLSDTYIESIDAYLPGRALPIKADFGTVWNGMDLGIPFDIVPANQPMVPIRFTGAADESDLGELSLCDTDGDSEVGCYPIPDNVSIEGGDDNHIILWQKSTCTLYEVYATEGGPGNWSGYSGAIWNLRENEVRPKGMTSADAAGLPILPGLIRYDEIYKDKVINHVTRVTLAQIQSAYLMPPASHSDGTSGQDRDLPPMGLQLRLRADYDISAFDQPIQVILKAFKKYGLIIADTGGQMYISGDHDDRWNDRLLRQLKRVKITDFEAVETGAVLVDYP